jgi:methylated-DNA-protein-cysteine methyltransferase related protein
MTFYRSMDLRTEEVAERPSGSFQRLWNVVEAIPEGNVASYGQVAKLAGLNGGARRVGGALAKAPDRGSLPWHRILKADGKIALPVGSTGRKEQIRRLEEEGVLVEKGRVDMKKFQWQPDMDELIWGPLGFSDADGSE